MQLAQAILFDSFFSKQQADVLLSPAIYAVFFDAGVQTQISYAT